MNGQRRQWLLLAGVLAGLGAAGCRPGPPAQVRGTVRYKGAALEGCLVTFLPEPGQPTSGPRSLGVSDAQGRFQLRRDDQRPGASRGWHRVTVYDLRQSSGVPRQDRGTVTVEEPRQPRPARTPARYADDKTTPLRREVQPGAQEIDLDLE